MSVTSFRVSGGFAAPSILQTPASPLVTLSAGQPFTRHWWLRAAGPGGGGSVVGIGNFRVYPRNVTDLLVQVTDGVGNIAEWNQTTPSALWSDTEWRSLMLTYDGSNVRAWVEGVEVPLTRTGLGTGVIPAGGTHVVINSSPEWRVDEAVFVRGQVITDPAVFRAGPQLQRRIGSLSGLTYWLRFEAADTYVDSGPNNIAFTLDSVPPFSGYNWAAGVALEPAPPPPVEADALIVAPGVRAAGFRASCVVQGADGSLVRSAGVLSSVRESAGVYRLRFAPGRGCGPIEHSVTVTPVAPSRRVLALELLEDGVRVQAFAGAEPRDTSFLVAWRRFT